MKFESITNFNNKNYSTIDSDDDITVPSKTIFKHTKYHFYGDNNHILYLDNIANYPINHEYYTIIIDINDLYSDDLNTSLNFAKKLIYNFDIIILEYDDDENIIGHNTIYDLYQCNRPTSPQTSSTITGSTQNPENNNEYLIGGIIGGSIVAAATIGYCAARNRYSPLRDADVENPQNGP